MLKENLQVKYNELNHDLGLNKLVLIAKDGDKVFYSRDGKEVAEKEFSVFSQKSGLNSLASKVIEAEKCNVVAFVYSNNIRYAGDHGGIPTILDDFTEIFGGKVKSVENSDKAILRALRKRRAVIVQDNYLIIRARSLDEAGTMTRIIDKNAFVLSKCSSYVTINPLAAFVMNMGFTYFYSKKNQARVWQKEKTEPIPQSGKVNVGEIKSIYNEDKRVEVLKIAQKMYADNLTQGTWGNVSVRIDDHTLYCTPKAISYNLLTPDDIVKMDFTKVKQLGGVNKATSEKGIHCRIMREHKDCYVAIHAHPTFSSIFASRNATLTVSPDGRSVLGDKVYSSKHALPMTKRLANNSVNAMKGGKASFMGNHGVAVYGTSIEEVFEVLNTLEKEAKMAIDAEKKLS